MLSPLGVFLPVDQLLAKECEPGDLVEIDRKLYVHWAIYVGDGQVVHLTEPTGDSGEAVVEKCSLESVAQDSLVRVNNKEVPARERDLTARPREEVVAAVLDVVGKTVNYNIVLCNGEHFVTRLKYGVGWSDQAKAMKESIASLSPTECDKKQVQKVHQDLWAEIHNILNGNNSLSSSPPNSPIAASDDFVSPAQPLS